MEKINSIGIGRTLVNGCALSQDLRKLIGDEIVRNGGDINTGYFPGKFSDVANAFKVSRTTVKNIWQRLHLERTTEPREHGGDLQLIETIKRERPTLSLREICDGLTEFGGIPKGTSRSAISRALNNNVVWFKIRISWKKNQHCCRRKIYSGEYGLHSNVHGLSPCQRSFQTQILQRMWCVKLPFHGKRLYGHAPVGAERFIELLRYHSSPKITVNLLAGLHGVECMSTIYGASDTIEFLRFFGEAGSAANIETARPALEGGDIVVMDNCATQSPFCWRKSIARMVK